MSGIFNKSKIIFNQALIDISYDNICIANYKGIHIIIIVGKLFQNILNLYKAGL